MNEQKKKEKFRFRNDLILIISVLFLSAAALVYLFVFRKSGNTVRVMVDGKVYGTYSLSENVSEDIVTGENGEHLNCFVINDGKVLMQKATCPDGICTSHRPIFRDGESIVCLPNRVVITVTIENGNASADIVA